ncbi:MAG: hypothetical protein EYC62_09510 [Alphaproteobacteria bacterium]|nr:MAG: hypothetical protein EYC62_09510 [Alphaproteobacteria bacterium]
MRIYLYLAGFCVILLLAFSDKLVYAQAIPFNFVKQWEAIPSESLASLIARPEIHFVGSDVGKIDDGMMVNVTYLENTGTPKALYRCVEYVREWQFETIQTNCYMAITPQSTVKR